MTLTVRLPDKLEQQLAEYCTTYRVTRSEAVKRALEDLLKPPESGQSRVESYRPNSPSQAQADRGRM